MLGILNIGYGIPLAFVCPADACFSGSIGIGLGVPTSRRRPPALNPEQVHDRGLEQLLEGRIRRGFFGECVALGGSLAVMPSLYMVSPLGGASTA